MGRTRLAGSDWTSTARGAALQVGTEGRLRKLRGVLRVPFASAVLCVAVVLLAEIATPRVGASPPSSHLSLAGSSVGGNVGPSEPSITAEVAEAKARLAANLAAPHPGVPEAVTHPDQDYAGSSGVPAGPDPPADPGNALGLDVSAYQGDVDWSQVVQDGASFAYAKATEGTYYIDSTYFPEQYDGAAQAGLVRGAYHFAIPDNSTGAAQADYFVANGGAWAPDGHTLPGMVDLEYNPYGQDECYGLTPSQMLSWVSSFVTEYDSLTGRLPVIYTTADWWDACTADASGFGALDPLWVTNFSGTPYPLPAGWTSYTIWQYADSGAFPGDQDLFNGTNTALASFAIGAPYALGAEGTDEGLWVQTPQLGPGWHSLGGQILAAPAVVGLPSTEGLASPLFIVTGTDHSLWERTLGSGWAPLATVPTYCLGSPGATVIRSVLYVACQGGDRGLWVAETTVSSNGLPSISAWSSLGGGLSAGPAVAPVGGVPTYFAEAGGGQIWLRSPATSWSPTSWFCEGHPAASVAPGGTTTWFGCHGADGQLWTSTNSGSGWSEAAPEGGALLGGPGLGITSTTGFFVAEGTDQAIWVATPTTSWTSLGGVVVNGVGAVGLG
jgi:GH25 family lysozyme M1 (1,4-beta-N-acetylmuramidase)